MRYYKTRKTPQKYFSWYEVCHVSSRLFISHHQIRIGWIYAPAEVQIIPCQIQGYVYFVVHPFLKQLFQADGYGEGT